MTLPRSSRRLRTPSSSSALTTAAFNLATTSAGVPFGAKIAFHAARKRATIPVHVENPSALKQMPALPSRHLLFAFRPWPNRPRPAAHRRRLALGLDEH